MSERSLSQYLAAANAPLSDPSIHEVVGEAPARFELFHFALSLCSQKVRVTLMEANARFRAHDINLPLPQLANYDPAYVRLRMLGHPDESYATGYTGRSSTESEGFDPAVVPTLVDLAEDRVIVDSLRICEYIDGAVDGSSLIPEANAESVRAELTAVDATPHVAIFYGAHPDGDFRPARLQKGMPGVHDRKIAKLEQARSLAADDPALLRAFDAKIQKERAAQVFVASPDQMRQAVSETLDIVGALEQRLPSGPEWACGDAFSLADVFLGRVAVPPQVAWLRICLAWGAPSQFGKASEGRGLCGTTLRTSGLPRGGDRMAENAHQRVRRRTHVVVHLHS